MILELHFICGLMFGFEYVDQDEANYYVLDLGIIRLMLASPKDQHFMAALRGCLFIPETVVAQSSNPAAILVAGL